MSEAVDMGMEEYGGEADIDKAYQEVCDEVGIEITSEAAGAGNAKMAASKKVVSTTEMEAKLNELKK